MIKIKEELNLKVQNARLLTRDELSEFEDQIPSVSMQYRPQHDTVEQPYLRID